MSGRPPSLGFFIKAFMSLFPLVTSIKLLITNISSILCAGLLLLPFLFLSLAYSSFTLGKLNTLV